MKVKKMKADGKTQSYQPRVFSASNHVEAGFPLFRVGHTERQAGELH